MTHRTADRVDAAKTRALDSLDAARHRTLALTACLGDDELLAQHSPLMSPLVWDLAHVGNQEEIWLVRGVGGRAAMRPGLDGLYDAFEHPRAERPELPLLRPAEAREYIAAVRARTVDVLATVELTDAVLLRGAFIFHMTAQHEHQHGETMLATHQLREGPAVLSATGPAPVDAGDLPGEVYVEGGPFIMGTDRDDRALDNERPAHPVDVPAFWIDAAPVTCADFQHFIADGGYDEPRWWSPDGWEHRMEAGLTAPLFWEHEGELWMRRRFGRAEPVPGDEPVVHVCWYEADAYARWAGRRLPTEAEWEKAASWDAAGWARRYPWGDDEPDPERANLGQAFLEPAPAGSYPAGEAPCGARQMIGDVWEWTASDFAPYPGFRALPDEGYSAAHFDGRSKVLRGGSFATHPDAVRATFRNWDFPVRRQIFAGFRTARDAV
ncbi:ergothioneine biosynthesis protein EgtB [Glycomyces arizonensis]|uniref:ergothioneine biosynthesis protein EgtB n=1 Tax=Glycomyces arizonensis TaxID=256035 RepID=UPI00040065B5|nr:ergothioneine biosynthesis protein EgtB [Glycomyces arizonensis]